jgi:hypothetical protein
MKNDTKGTLGNERDASVAAEAAGRLTAVTGDELSAVTGGAVNLEIDAVKGGWNLKEMKGG